MFQSDDKDEGIIVDKNIIDVSHQIEHYFKS